MRIGNRHASFSFLLNVGNCKILPVVLKKFHMGVDLLH